MQNNFTDIWTAVYYPNSVIEDQRTRTILCLLFDRIICHLPVMDLVCGGGFGMANMLEDNDLLAQNGIIEYTEEILLDEVEMPEKAWDNQELMWKFSDMQTTVMALKRSVDMSVVPVTDQINYQVPFEVLNNDLIFKNAKLQAASLAISSIEMVLPQVNELEDSDILELREKLSDELIPFRKSMIKLAPTIRQFLEEGASLKDVYYEARYIAETNIMPSLDELQNKMKKENGSFWRKVLQTSGVFLPKLILNWSQHNYISSLINSIDDLSSIASIGIQRQMMIDSLKKGGFGYLLSLDKNVQKMNK